MIDDLATVNTCGAESIISNSITNKFIESKRLELGQNKSHRIHIGSRKNKQICPKLKVHNKQMEDSTEERYVGDIITADGKIDSNIQSRKRRGFAISGDILAILEEVPFGQYRVKAGIAMRNGMLLSSMLNNSEVWYQMKNDHYEELEKVDEYLI